MSRKQLLMLGWSVGVVLYLSGTILAQKPLSIDDIERLLRTKVLPDTVAEVVRKEGVQFELTEALRTRLRQAGATAEVMAAIERTSAARTRQRLEEAQKQVDELRRQAEDTQRRLDELEQQRQAQGSKQQQIQTLLSRAREQVAAKRMTTPAGNNALETYRAVLQLDSKQAEAVAGLAGIKEQYIQWAEDARQQQEWDKAETFYERALRVEPNDSSVIAARQAVQEAKVAARKAAEEQKAADAEQRHRQLLEEPKRQALEEEVSRDIVLSSVFFQPGTLDLTPAARSRIPDIADILNNQARGRHISIEGHTDSGGSEDANQRLSERQAEIVANELVKNGVRRSRITTKGFGERYPVAPNDNLDGSDNELGRSKNRRVDMIIEN